MLIIYGATYCDLVGIWNRTWHYTNHHSVTTLDSPTGAGAEGARRTVVEVSETVSLSFKAQSAYLLGQIVEINDLGQPVFKAQSAILLEILNH